MPQPTRNALINWGNGHQESAYLAHGILIIEKYEHINPIHPQGGKDGKKDFFCSKGGILHIAACYFPNNSVLIKFKDLRKKFLNDLKGVSANQAKGFIFITNMAITSGNRAKLILAATRAGCVACVIYHLESLKGILDSPQGYGLREKHLGISMTSAEKISAKAASDQKLLEEIKRNLKRQKMLKRQQQETESNLAKLLAKAFQQARNTGIGIKPKKGVRKKL